MSEQPRDWDKELAEIDRAMARAPAGSAGQPVAAGAPVQQPVRPAAARPPARRAAVVGAWLLVLLLVGASVLLVRWPYPRSCGLRLYAYLAAILGTFLVGLWAAVTTWRHHRALAHTLALLAMGWAVALGAREVLPRIGYARISAPWSCPAAPPAGATPAPGSVPTSGTPATGSAPAAPTPGTSAPPAAAAPTSAAPQ